MHIKLKLTYLNYAVMLLIIPVLITLQNSVWPAIFNNKIPIFLWIPFIIYWALYRKTTETIFIMYFITISIASTSFLFIGYLLVFHTLMLLTIYFFKRVYYVNWMFFNIACAIALFLFPIILWILFNITDNKIYFPKIISWVGGGGVTWILSFVILGFLQWIDSLTITPFTGSSNRLKRL